HPRKVVALGNHLGADQHVDRAVAESGQDRVERALAAHRIAIQARNPGLRTEARDFRLDALGAKPGLFEIWTGAERTLARYPGRIVAIVTAGARGRRESAGRVATASPLAMHDERHAAVGT